ncbi:MAG: TraX family protein [Candidatus Wallacebacter cryptica]|jgi:hypothetical protein|nr:pilus assembly protein [Bacillota bacterium]
MPKLTGFQIKTMAIAAMLLDHIAWAFLDLHSCWGQLLHFLGRITAPTMCFFIVQGYLHTRSVPRYFARLAVFALISHFPYVYFRSGRLTLYPFSVIYTLALGLLAVWCWDKMRNSNWRIPALIGIAVFSTLGDWMYFIPAFCLLFYIYRRDPRQQAFGIGYIAFVIAFAQFFGTLVSGAGIQSALLGSGYHLGIMLSIPLIRLYNGERGGGKFSKWMFYIFYPAHLFILGLILYT